jgi:hypothetical protein
MGYACVLAIPVACVAWTVTQEELLREFREWLKAFQGRHSNSLWWRKVAYMPTCSYCFSHYVAALFVGLFGFKMLVDDWRGYLVSGLTVVLMANVYLSIYCMLRAVLRERRARADQAEARLAAEKEHRDHESRAARHAAAVPLPYSHWPASRRKGAEKLRRLVAHRPYEPASNGHH